MRASRPGSRCGALEATLDFVDGPRWKGAAVGKRSGRVDRIYLRAANRFGIVPSDHYGVFVDLEVSR